VPQPSHWSQAESQRYAPVKVDTSFYDEREQPASPASSSGSQYGAQSQPVSPTTPYAYGQYGSHHASSQSGLHPSKYESSPNLGRSRISLSHTTSQMQSTSPAQPHPQNATYASGYSQAYPGSMSSAASALSQQGPASSVSSYSGNAVSVGVYSSNQIDSHAGQQNSSDSHCSYPQSSYSYGSQGYVSQSSASHTRSSSPPVHLAPIQTDRLVHRSASIPSLPALSSATNMASHYSSAHGGMHDVPRSAASGLNVASQYSSAVPHHAPSQHSPAHEGQMQYPYSSYSSLSANGSHSANSWRPEHQIYRRSSLAV